MQRFLWLLVGAGPGMQRAGLCSLGSRHTDAPFLCPTNSERGEAESIPCFPADGGPCSSGMLPSLCFWSGAGGRVHLVKAPITACYTREWDKCPVSNEQCFCNKRSDEWGMIYCFQIFPFIDIQAQWYMETATTLFLQCCLHHHTLPGPEWQCQVIFSGIRHHTPVWSCSHLSVTVKSNWHRTNDQCGH